MSKYEERKARIKELLRKQEEIETEMRSLLDPEPIPVLPPGFSVSEEVKSLVRQSGTEGISSQELLNRLQKQYPSYGIDRERVASALAYLKNSKKEITSVESKRGVYRTIENQSV